MPAETDTLNPEQYPDEAIGLNRDSLSDRSYSRLRVSLLTGLYAPGTRLSIRKLADMYHTSPTPVREAIFQLVREGALELKLGYQPRVPELSIAQYINIRETRAPLERLAAELSTVNITDDEIQKLREFHQAFMDCESAEKWKAALVANQEFHFTIYRASRNEILVRCIENLWLLAGPIISYQYPHIRQAAAEMHPHLLVIDALSRRSPAEAGELVVQDLREGSYRIIEQMKADAVGEPKKKTRKARSPA